ncbi:prepilin-type N-terminal cleavage/methylation domain-containing protein [Moraxella osloensis]|uniref:prepilin-type N-terminal cleavage/methylation domain-containing protein n=1 Tax=Faucicola osloensis TaxID=34062 RepID=UPI002006B75D
MSPFSLHSSAATAAHKTSQQGFTLIELMIALVIFAMLALAGWQIMDSLTKSRERGYQHQKSLSQLDYAYLQLSQDLAQTSNYVAVPILSATAYANANNTASANTAAMTPTFVLNASQISFIRFAAPDPRYQSSPMLAKIQYSVAGEALTKRRFYQLDDNNETPATSVLLTGIKDASWRALTPDAVSVFPDEATLQKLQQIQAQKNTNQTANASTNPTPNPPDNTTDQNSNLQNRVDLTPYQQLPRGIELNFSYQGEPITWRFALPSTPPNAPNP